MFMVIVSLNSSHSSNWSE